LWPVVMPNIGTAAIASRATARRPWQKK
jgi:hypothetical protein